MPMLLPAHRHVRMVSGLGSTALAQQFDRDRCAAISATCPPSHEYPLPMPARYVTLPAPAGRSRGIVIVIRGPGGRSRSWRGQGRCAGRFYGSYEVPGTHTAGSANVGQTAVAVTEGEDLPCLALCASRVTPNRARRGVRVPEIGRDDRMCA